MADWSQTAKNLKVGGLKLGGQALSDIRVSIRLLLHEKYWRSLIWQYWFCLPIRQTKIPAKFFGYMVFQV